METHDRETGLLDSSCHENKDLKLVKDKILCIHCKRTSSNGIRCLGMCVADNDY